MAATRIAVVQAALTGIALGASAADVANGNIIANGDGKTYLHVLNSSGSTPYNVTLTARNTTRPADTTFPAQTVADAVIAVAQSVEKIIGPIPPAYVDTNGDVTVSGANAALKFSPFRLG